MTSGIGTERLVRLSTPTRCLAGSAKQPTNVLKRTGPRRPGLGDSEGKAVGLGGLSGAGREPVGEGLHGGMYDSGLESGRTGMDSPEENSLARPDNRPQRNPLDSFLPIMLGSVLAGREMKIEETRRS
jgi:hypothetical protein